MMETSVNTDGLKYTTSGKIVRPGGRHFKTIEEKERERQETQKKAELQGQSRARIEARFLTPRAKNFVETPEVAELTNTVQLWNTAGYPVHIIGPTGCGKTTLALAVAERLNRPAVWINGDAEMTTSDLVGEYNQYLEERYIDRFVHNVFKSRETVQKGWVDNPLTLACMHGYSFIYNEFSRTKPEANNVLLSVFEEGVLEIPTKAGEERYIKVHPDFKAILTSNSIDYAGVFQPQDALLDRMVAIHMDFYDFDTEVEIAKAQTGISTKEAKRIVKIVRALRDRLPDEQKPGTRAAIMIAQGLKLLNGHGAADFEKTCFTVLASKTRRLEDMTEKRRLVKEIINETKTAGS